MIKGKGKVCNRKQAHLVRVVTNLPFKGRYNSIRTTNPTHTSRNHPTVSQEAWLRQIEEGRFIRGHFVSLRELGLYH